MKIFGFIPARMKAYRFPGKPLALIHGKPMIEHVHERASEFADWDTLAICTPDAEILDFCVANKWRVIMTNENHPRAMDRCAEAANIMAASADDIVVVVQGDEPMVTADMIEKVVAPIVANHVTMTLLAVPIIDFHQYRSPDTVKVVSSVDDMVLYTSRSAIPFCEDFTPELGAKRIGGVFAFRKYMLDKFMAEPEHPLEIAESCDSNRICGNGWDQLCVTLPYYRPYFSVDRPADIELVEQALVSIEEERDNRELGGAS